jgi:hypothetical protein
VRPFAQTPILKKKKKRNQKTENTTNGKFLSHSKITFWNIRFKKINSTV